jgi:tRNA1(Val) A37 N6-methylase TrmN6
MKNTGPEAGDDETLDSFYHGRIRIIQKKKGYRFSVDAPLLADFIQTHPSDVLIELGAGSGIISLLLSLKPFRRIVCLEVQPGLAELARRNVRLNRLERKIAVLEQDLRTFAAEEKFDLVFANPPYLKKRGGQLSLSEEKSIAKHEIRCSISDIMHLAGTVLKEDGRACFIYPARRKADFDDAVERNGLKVKALRYVYPGGGRPARWFLAECDFRSPGAEVRPPLFIYDEQGEYTAEMKRIFSGEGCVASV